MQKVGIIMGAGPTASSFFYEKFIRDYREKYNEQPELVLYNLPIKLSNEKMWISSCRCEVTDSYNAAIDEAVNFMKHNSVDFLAFPCFSLSQITERKCKENQINFINPFNYIPITDSQKVGVIAVNQKVELINILESKLEKKIVYPSKYTLEIQNLIQDIICNNRLDDTSDLFIKIEQLFSELDISDYIIACSELCLLNFHSKMNRINLMEILINQTINLTRETTLGNTLYK